MTAGEAKISVACLMSLAASTSARSSDDFGFTEPLLLRGRGERGGNFWGEGDIFDEGAFDGNAPFASNITKNFRDFESDGFTFCHDALDDTCTDYMTEGGFGTLHESLAKVRDTRGSSIWVGNLEVDVRVAVREVV